MAFKTSTFEEKRVDNEKGLVYFERIYNNRFNSLTVNVGYIRHGPVYRRHSVNLYTGEIMKNGLSVLEKRIKFATKLYTKLK